MPELCIIVVKIKFKQGYHLQPLADPDIRLGGQETRHSAKGGNLISVLVSHIYFFIGGAKIYSQTGWGPWPDFPPGSANVFN